MISARELNTIAYGLGRDLFRNRMTITISDSPFGSFTGFKQVGTVSPTFMGITMTPNVVDQQWQMANGMTIIINQLMVSLKSINPRFREDLFLLAIRETNIAWYKQETLQDEELRKADQEATSRFLGTPEIGD
jgi:hypothetical protein